MDASSAVYPTVRPVGSDLMLAYYLPGCRDSAVAIFRAVVDWQYGSPNDEGLRDHPLWGAGLTFYNFHTVHADKTRRWIATFHDGTFEVTAASAEILESQARGIAPWDALTRVAGPGGHQRLDELTA